MARIFPFIFLLLRLPCNAHPGLANVNENPPDTIFVHGDIYTGVPGTRAQAIAVRGERIAAVGLDSEIRKLKGISLFGRATCFRSLQQPFASSSHVPRQPIIDRKRFNVVANAIQIA